MKMVMPMKATESGKITHNLSPGSVITAGDLLASLELRDPSKVKKIEDFDGKLNVPADTIDYDPATLVQNILRGFRGDPEAAASAVFETVGDMESASALVRDTLAEFLGVENMFIGKLQDDVVRDMTKANADNLDVVIDANLAHQQLKMRSALVLAMLRQVETFPDRFGAAQLPGDLLQVLEEAAQVSSKSCFNVVDGVAFFKCCLLTFRTLTVSRFEAQGKSLRRDSLDRRYDYPPVEDPSVRQSSRRAQRSVGRQFNESR